MATSGDIVEKVVDEVLEYIQKYGPESFQKLNADGSKKVELIAKVKQIAEDEIAHGEQLKCNGGDVTKLDLPQGRLVAIQNGLQTGTYRVDIADGVAKHTFPDDILVNVMTVPLDTQENKDYSYNVQVASIIIDGVFLALGTVGLKETVSKEVLKKATKELVKELLTSDAFRKAVEEFVGIAYTALEEALFGLLKAMLFLGKLWNLIEILCSEMSSWDSITTAALVAAQLFAALATGGIVLIAKFKIALAFNPAFFQKIQILSIIMP